jgi:hypothetical protein
MTNDTDTDTTTPCAGEGNGYWLCDVVGGCAGCRELAAAIDDTDQLADWKAEAEAEVEAPADEVDHGPYGGEVARRRCRMTDTTVVLLDLARPDARWAGDPADGGRWLTLCDDHSTICQHESRRTAVAWMAEPSWCGTCAARLDADAAGVVFPEQVGR